MTKTKSDAEEKNKSTYIIWVPSGIGGVFLRLNDHIGHQHHSEHRRTDQHPARLPENVGLRPGHELNVLAKAVGQRLKNMYIHIYIYI